MSETGRDGLTDGERLARMLDGTLSRTAVGPRAGMRICLICGVGLYLREDEDGAPLPPAEPMGCEGCEKSESLCDCRPDVAAFREEVVRLEDLLRKATNLCARSPLCVPREFAS